jgi:uncharacterized protein
MIMRLVLALAVAALAALHAATAAAQAPPAYYCDPLHIYNYPGAPNCPVPWRAVASPTLPQPYGAPSASQGPIALMPPAARPRFPVLGDGLDDWCRSASLPSSIAICSDGDLRALVIERQHAFDEAKARLDPEQQKALLADQNSWVRSYPRTCGLTDAPPSLPLTPTIKDCMEQAGRARIAYLKAYDGTSAAETTPAPAAENSPPTQPETVSKQFRCRDPRSNFEYARPQPCAAGDITLAGPVRPPAAEEVAPSPSAPARNLVDVLGSDPSDRTCLDFGGPNASPEGSPGWLKCKASDDAMDARAQSVWDGWTPDQRAAFLNDLHSTIDADPRDRNWKPTGAASKADWGVVAKYAEIAGCGAPMPGRQCPSETAPQPGAPAEKTGAGDCNSNWQQCADNSDLVNHYSGWTYAQAACETAIDNNVQYGKPKWRWFVSLSSFLKGDDYVKTGRAIAIDSDVQLQNMYGAMVHAEVWCTFDLREKKVIGIMSKPAGLLRPLE